MILKQCEKNQLSFNPLVFDVGWGGEGAPGAPLIKKQWGDFRTLLPKDFWERDKF